MGSKTPNDGGCWFCYTDDGELSFSMEFDTWFHMDCLSKALEKGNPEAEVIADEYGITYETKFPDGVEYDI